MRQKSGTKKRRQILAILIAVVFVAGCAMLGREIFSLRAKNAELEARKARLEQLLEDENLRKELLGNEEVYIQTKKYIE